MLKSNVLLEMGFLFEFFVFKLKRDFGLLSNRESYGVLVEFKKYCSLCKVDAPTSS